MTVTKTLEVRDILKLVPHRWPMVLIDRVTAYDLEAGTLTALKNVSYNEGFFPGHFPAVPTMPGVLMLEAMAQACGIFAVLKSGISADSGYILYFAGIDEARFKRPVIPGDQLVFQCTFLKQKRDLWKFSCKAMVGDELACEAVMMCVVRPPQA